MVVHHLLTPSLVRYEGREVDTVPTPADCPELGLLDEQFAQDGAYEEERDC
ncbi:hypothetical protein ACFWFU_07140 [Streptomyces sp. NPDC060235]|uniref:hypothetical protein n=1 Tax=Streptomyces sp. NPDC060235 TaxID=3347080 RepID=UPI0036504F7D